jgi:hypothetical protein
MGLDQTVHRSVAVLASQVIQRKGIVSVTSARGRQVAGQEQTSVAAFRIAPIDPQASPESHGDQPKAHRLRGGHSAACRG